MSTSGAAGGHTGRGQASEAWGGTWAPSLGQVLEEGPEGTLWAGVLGQGGPAAGRGRGSGPRKLLETELRLERAGQEAACTALEGRVTGSPASMQGDAASPGRATSRGRGGPGQAGARGLGSHGSVFGGVLSAQRSALWYRPVWASQAPSPVPTLGLGR